MIKIAMTEIVHVPDVMSHRRGGEALRRPLVIAGCVLAAQVLRDTGWVST
jgi:hypothetical protein